MSRTIKFKKEDSSEMKLRRSMKKAAHKAARRVKYVEYFNAESMQAANLYEEAARRKQQAELLMQEAQRLINEANLLRKKADACAQEVTIEVEVSRLNKCKWNFEGQTWECTKEGSLPKWEIHDKLEMHLGLMEKDEFYLKYYRKDYRK